MNGRDGEHHRLQACLSRNHHYHTNNFDFCSTVFTESPNDSKRANDSLKMDDLKVPVNRPLQLNLNELEYSDLPPQRPMYLDHSPGLSQKIKIPKKRYSYADPLERMDTPMFDKV
ncbi:unnamed protein product [Nippostrongylus brasiliensis]|uniref:Miff domain-containing protein n=2 Tax=Nippostrongylus brasiliensis TaxID=27835 RepID=A0A0N4YSI3_NIPBR|nr:unnamed protein product [Nippostrongylus brasiliensis]